MAHGAILSSTCVSASHGAAPQGNEGDLDDCIFAQYVLEVVHSSGGTVAVGIVMDSVPGDLEQIFTNLIMNSIRHGFEARGSGHVVIEASEAQGRVEIVYQDDGVGRGGSGLGMFIVHNLVYGSLKGEIKLDSEPGHGARFTLILPMVTP